VFLVTFQTYIITISGGGEELGEKSPSPQVRAGRRGGVEQKRPGSGWAAGIRTGAIPNTSSRCHPTIRAATDAGNDTAALVIIKHAGTYSKLHGFPLVQEDASGAVKESLISVIVESGLFCKSTRTLSRFHERVILADPIQRNWTLSAAST
jgi:hypothetical protein